MAKYYLVASYYNMKTKEYENETIIKSLDGHNLSTLEHIDDFTTSHTIPEILSILEREQGKMGFNHLAIVYLKNQSSTPNYYRIIDNDKRFNTCLKSAKPATNYILGKQRNTIYLNQGNELYREELAKLLDILENRNYELFKSIYPLNNDFSFLVKRYIDSDYDNNQTREEDLRQVLLEFSRYKTFRGWYSNQKKLKNNLNFKRSSNIPSSSTMQNKAKKKVVVHSIKENIEEYEEKFEKEQGVSYSSYNTNQYNMDNDEFLSEEEYLSMHSDEYDDSKSLGRRH